jgi:hypothetical protein
MSSSTEIWSFFLVVGAGSTDFTVEVHHGGFFCGLSQNRAYLNEKVDYFDDCKAELWSFMGIEEITMMLDYGFGGQNLSVYWLLPGKDLSDGLRIIRSDEDTIVMAKLTDRVKTFVLYYDHNNHVGNTIAREKLPDFYNNLQSNSGTRLNTEIQSDEDSEDPDFYDSDYEVEEDDDDLFCDNVDEVVSGQCVPFGKRGFASNILEDEGWDEIDTDEEQLELPESDEEGELGKNFTPFRPEDFCNPIFKIGMKFPSVEVLRKAITEYSLKNRVEIVMPRNDRTRIQAFCADGCPWTLYASMDKRLGCFLVRRYVGDHNCVKKWVLKRCTAKWLAEKYMDKCSTSIYWKQESCQFLVCCRGSRAS